MPLLVDPSKVDPETYIGFREEYAFAVRGCLEGQTTIDVLGLNREELAEVRRDRLATLKDLARLCELLREKVAATPTQELSEQLRVWEERLKARREAAGEYSAMARAFLNQFAI
jgi:hypothetical protein